jgi:hypothetical protein
MRELFKVWPTRFWHLSDTEEDQFPQITQRFRLDHWLPEYHPQVTLLARNADKWVEALRHLPHPPLVVIEDPLFFPALTTYVAQQKIPWIAVCQNLESLSPARVIPEHALTLFTQEMSLLRQSRCVITISREEDFILHGLGITTLWIPYFPITPLKDELLAIRQAREDIPKKQAITLGQFQNIYTRNGAMALARHWQTNQMDRIFGPLWVGGFNCERFFPPTIFGSAVEILGTIPPAELGHWLSQTTCCICIQFAGGGALTRIPEMQLAGVPVIANFHAARSYFGSPGITVIQDLEELTATLKRLPQQPPIPIPTAPDTSQFTRTIQTIVSAPATMSPE